jgi:UDP-N-acetylglucosamine 2-epimerase (non-hydrolysing)
MILRIPVIHLHGGEITEGAYDDSIRHAITKLSYMHGTSTETYRQRVIQLGESPERVRNIGAIGLDHLTRSKFMDINALSQSLGFELNSKYFLITYHPVTLGYEPPEESFQALLEALESYLEYKLIITYPNADDGGRLIIPMIEAYASVNNERVLSIASLGQLRYLSAVKHASAVIGNSSSGIIEVPAFDVPTVNIGERQKGRLAAKSVIHCKAISSDIENAVEIAVSRSYKTKDEYIENPYGQGNSSTQVIDMIKSLNFKPSKPFYDLQLEFNE